MDGVQVWLQVMSKYHVRINFSCDFHHRESLQVYIFIPGLALVAATTTNTFCCKYKTVKCKYNDRTQCLEGFTHLVSSPLRYVYGVLKNVIKSSCSPNFILHQILRKKKRVVNLILIPYPCPFQDPCLGIGLNILSEMKLKLIFRRHRYYSFFNVRFVQGLRL